ncbi:hypothetical protein O6B72_01730 [Campylobacter ureolyticus]|uniref:hypothetical protein n=1 Tax=Campylobacter ureolyticus TaxID=827 RepID=UPI0022B462C4|nr:hypothetical protein [Campylobacter ureolyticus]MCZ6155542.1 hypothetical protein [Campylobacter ureolyticus]
MSDDKREKLREYLRNNRPKNRVNLGNNSNNKEKSNRNLDKNLNSDNSQISNNKSNKRDYDKEPLIIRDYNMHETAFFTVYSFYLILFLITQASFSLQKELFLYLFFWKLF